MTDYKLTDEKVIKGLECCGSEITEGYTCDACPYMNKGCNLNLLHDSLALINRQKCEIESLQAVHADMTESLRLAAEANKDMQAEIERLQKYNTDVAFKHYNDGIKELAKRFKEIDVETFEEYDKWGLTYVSEERIHNAIDTIVKEMTEGK